MKISLIAAVSLNNVIGSDGKIPWRLRDDFLWFKSKTLNRHVIMGSKTYESLGKPLPQRTNIVISRNSSFNAKCQVVTNLQQAFNICELNGEDEVFIIGGSKIYELAIPFAGTFYRTKVMTYVEGNVKFPSFDESQWSVKSFMQHPANENNEHPFTIETLVRNISDHSMKSD